MTTQVPEEFAHLLRAETDDEEPPSTELLETFWVEFWRVLGRAKAITLTVNPDSRQQAVDEIAEMLGEDYTDTKPDDWPVLDLLVHDTVPVGEVWSFIDTEAKEADEE
jgi:hypothetical protein